MTQLCIGTKRKDDAMLTEGKATIQRYMGIAPTTKEEAIDIKHGVMLLADPGKACEYSRDGQQDLDEKQLER